MATGNVKKEKDELADAIQGATESAKSGAMIIRRSLIDRIATLLGATFPYVVSATIVVLMWNGRPGEPNMSAPSSMGANPSSTDGADKQVANGNQNPPPRVGNHDEPMEATLGNSALIERQFTEFSRVLDLTDRRLQGLEAKLSASSEESQTRWQTLDERWNGVQKEFGKWTTLHDHVLSFASTVNENAWRGREKRISEAIGNLLKMSAENDKLRTELEDGFATLLTNKVSNRLDDLTQKVAANESALQGMREQFKRAARQEHVAVIFHHNMFLNAEWYLPELNAALQLGRLTTFPHYQLRVYRGTNDAVRLEWPQSQVTEIARQHDEKLERPATLEIHQRVFATFLDPAGELPEVKPRRRCVLIVSPKCPPIVPNIQASAAWQGVQTSVLVLEGRLPNTPEIDANEYRSILNGWQQFCQWNQGQAIWFNLELEEKHSNNPSAGNPAPKTPPAPAPVTAPANGQKSSPRGPGAGAADSPNLPNTKGQPPGARQPPEGAGAVPNTQLPPASPPVATPRQLTPECARALRETLFRLLAPSFPVE